MRRLARATCNSAKWCRILQGSPISDGLLHRLEAVGYTKRGHWTAGTRDLRRKERLSPGATSKRCDGDLSTYGPPKSNVIGT
jgi:hypothetical protein